MSLICPECGTKLGLQAVRQESRDSEAHQPVVEAQDSVGEYISSKAKRRKYSYDNPKFNEFWDLYPNRVGKRDAFRNWQAAVHDGADPDRIIDAVRRFVAWCALNPWYTPKYPEGWLSAGRWEDELNIPAAVGATDPAYIVGTPEYAARIQSEEDRAIAEMR